MKRIIVVSVSFFVILFPSFSQGDENLYESFFIEACDLWQVPLPLALAIARTESGLNPWAVNVQGKGYPFESQEAAAQRIAQAWDQGASFDVGLMQINSYWMRRYGLDPQMLLEPRKNVIMGVWILSKEIERFGLTWRAVASYHTPVAKNPERGKFYARSVIQRIKTEENKGD